MKSLLLKEEEKKKRKEMKEEKNPINYLITTKYFTLQIDSGRDTFSILKPKNKVIFVASYMANEKLKKKTFFLRFMHTHTHAHKITI